MRGIAVPVVDAVISAARNVLPTDNPVVAAIHDVISVETIDEGEPIRAIDALYVVSQLEVALRPHQRGPSVA